MPTLRSRTSVDLIDSSTLVTYITDEESDRGNFTIYLTYRDAGDSDNESNEFFDNEVLQTVDDISFSSTFIAAGEGFASTISSDAPVTGMAYIMAAGVYFLRGHFVDVKDEVLILDQYSNTTSHKIGFQIREDIISADIDPSPLQHTDCPPGGICMFMAA